jgi:prepilin-type N-terminal cleavage/methylation domain-containing protein
MKKSGFTLIELIVSVSIIVMVTGIFLVNYNSANRRTDLTMTAQKLVSDIRLTQNYALGLARYGGRFGVVPYGGWGVHFDTNANNQYTIFADINENKAYDADEANVADGGQITVLPDNVYIESVQIPDDSTTSKVDVTFLPPDPITTIMNSDSFATSSEVIITLKDSRTEVSKRIQVNFLGLAEVLE